MIDKYKVFGAPGTGKTEFLTNLAMKRINEGIKPDELGIFTFSNSAAEVLKDKISKATGIWKKDFEGISTIHSQCNKQLKEQIDDQYKLVEKEDIENFCELNDYQVPSGYTLFEEANDWVPQPLEENNYWGALAVLHTRFPGSSLSGAWKGLPLPPGASREDFTEWKEKWEGYKEEKSLLEFPDMPRLTWENGLGVKYKVQMYDEHQDANPALQKVARQWMGRALEVFICGDPYQTLYNYQGCSPIKFMSNPGKPVVLKKTHRLAPDMWNIGLEVIAQVPDYFPSFHPITAVQPNHEKKCDIHRCGYEELEDIVLQLERMNSSTLILARSKWELIDMAGRLATTGIIFRSLGAHEYGWPESLMHLVNIYFRLRNGDSLTGQQARCFVREMAPNEFTVKAFSLVDHNYDFIELKDLDTKTKYDVSLMDIWHRALKGLKFGKQQEAVKARVERGKGITKPFRRKIGLGTIHSAKGLDADNVVLYDKISRKMAHDLEHVPGLLEEESLVWYVGVTRAKKRLFVLTSKGSSFPIPV